MEMHDMVNLLAGANRINVKKRNAGEASRKPVYQPDVRILIKTDSGKTVCYEEKLEWYPQLRLTLPLGVVSQQQALETSKFVLSDRYRPLAQKDLNRGSYEETLVSNDLLISDITYNSNKQPNWGRVKVDVAEHCMYSQDAPFLTEDNIFEGYYFPHESLNVSTNHFDLSWEGFSDMDQALRAEWGGGACSRQKV